jgi:uncharacterized protein
VNTYGHVEIPSTDLKIAARFYGSLFGWQMKPMPGAENEYVLYNNGDATLGGIQKVANIPYNDKYINYVEVADVDNSLRKAVELGAKVIRERTALPVADWGAIGIFQSPDGYCMGLWEPGKA